MSHEREEIEERCIQEGVSRPSKPTLNLFKPKYVKNPEYWQCIYYIAPTNEKKKWKASDKIGLYCKVCEHAIWYCGYG